MGDTKSRVRAENTAIFPGDAGVTDVKKMAQWGSFMPIDSWKLKVD